jgi:dihydropteroate synthase
MSARRAAPEPAGLPEPLQGLGRPLVFGVLNVTPDSFSDGGAFLEPDIAVAHGVQMAALGADVVDVGGESTRPGAVRVDEAEERRRVIPVIRELTAEGVPVSIDTMRSSVAEAAIEAGAVLLNDVSGGLADETMAKVAAESGLPYVVMHWRAHSTEMATRAVYDDVVADVVTELRDRVDALLSAGVSEDQLVIDPGLGFAKDGEHNWSLLRRLGALESLGRPLLIGASRKRFLGELLHGPDGALREPTGRDVATAALSALLAERGVWAVRVHDVRSTIDALSVVQALAGLDG